MQIGLHLMNIHRKEHEDGLQSENHINQNILAPVYILVEYDSTNSRKYKRLHIERLRIKFKFSPLENLVFFSAQCEHVHSVPISGSPIFGRPAFYQLSFYTKTIKAKSCFQNVQKQVIRVQFNSTSTL